ncbi:hypothetical protein V3G39_09385 [Dermatophilaceae bacterium Sec6.4]
MSAPSTPEVRALAGFSIRELLQDLTTLQDRVSADAAAHGYRSSPGGVARRAVIRKRERAITDELRHRRSTSPGPPPTKDTP